MYRGNTAYIRHSLHSLFTKEPKAQGREQNRWTQAMNAMFHYYLSYISIEKIVDEGEKKPNVQGFSLFKTTWIEICTC